MDGLLIEVLIIVKNNYSAVIPSLDPVHSVVRGLLYNANYIVRVFKGIIIKY